MTVKISILGAGPGGIGLAGHLAMQGYPVTLWSDKDHASKLRGLIDGTGISMSGAIEGFANIQKATLDIKEAVVGADVIFLAVPRTAHVSTVQLFIDLLKEHQILIICAAQFSYLEIKHAFNRSINNTLVMSSFPYACRADASGNVRFLGMKDIIGVASHSKAKTNELLEKTRSFLPQKKYIIYEDTIDLGLNIPEGIIHPINMFFSAARIDNGDSDFFFYKDGISKKTSHVHDMVDEERMTICKLYGYKQITFAEIVNKYYDTHFKSIYDFCKNSKVHNLEKVSPNSLEHRYVNEVPYLLVPWWKLGKNKGFHAKTIESIIHLFSLINNTNYFEQVNFI
jgi:opine dehydrogenase